MSFRIGFLKSAPLTDTGKILSDLANNPDKYLSTELTGRGKRPDTVLRDPTGKVVLKECTCSTIPIMRTFFAFTRKRRAITGSTLLSAAEGHFSAAASHFSAAASHFSPAASPFSATAGAFESKQIARRPLKALSFGFGDGLQDFLLAAGFINRDFSLDLIVIENNVTALFMTALSTLNLLKVAARDKNCTFSVTHYLTIYDYLASHPQPQLDLVWAIDFDHFIKEYESLCMAFLSLQQNGLFFFAERAQDFLFKRSSPLPQVVGYSSAMPPPLAHDYRDFIAQIPKVCLQLDEKHEKDTRVTLCSATKIYDNKVLMNILFYRGCFENRNLDKENATELSKGMGKIFLLGEPTRTDRAVVKKT